jgi:hypothetical protein
MGKDFVMLGELSRPYLDERGRLRHTKSKFTPEESARIVAGTSTVATLELTRIKAASKEASK